MGSFSSKSKTTSHQTIAPNPTYAPQVNDAAAQLGPGFQQAQANVTQNVMPRINQGLDYYGDTLAGKYLNGNPYLEGVIGDTNRGITNEVNSQFEGAGRYGSGNHAGVLADRVAANENALRFGSYATERGYQNDAPRGVAALGALSAAAPQMASSQYAEAIAALLGKYVNADGTSVTKQSPGIGNILSGLIGSGLSAFASGGLGGFGGGK